MPTNIIYKRFCFDYNCHLCEEYLKSGIHICHNEKNIVNIKTINPLYSSPQ